MLSSTLVALLLTACPAGYGYDGPAPGGCPVSHFLSGELVVLLKTALPATFHGLDRDGRRTARPGIDAKSMVRAGLEAMAKAEPRIRVEPAGPEHLWLNAAGKRRGLTLKPATSLWRVAFLAGEALDFVNEALGNTVAGGADEPDDPLEVAFWQGALPAMDADAALYEPADWATRTAPDAVAALIERGCPWFSSRESCRVRREDGSYLNAIGWAGRVFVFPTRQTNGPGMFDAPWGGKAWVLQTEKKQSNWEREPADPTRMR